MKTVRVAFRHLSLARGCALQEGEELRHEMEVAGFKVNLYLGKKPELTIVSQPKGSIPFDSRKKEPTPMTISYQKAEESQHAGEMFTEVFTTKEFQISEMLFEQFNTPETELKAKVEILNKIKSEHGENFFAVSSLVAGILGLRYHFQYVFETINETFWAWNNRGQYWGPDSAYSSALQILEHPDLTPSGMQQIKSLQFNQDMTIEQVTTAAIPLSLLIKGWQEQDHITKFINFFTAIEVVTKKSIDGSDDISKETIGKFKTLVAEHTEGKEKSEFLEFLSKLSSFRKSLNMQFEELARTARFESCQDDIDAFKHFYRVRNRLFHAGDTSEIGSFKSANGKTIQLQCLAEQYVNWAIFNDDRYYESRFREKSRIEAVKKNV